ncbi:MAG: hypothetical protein OEZ02_09030 [Anaerolineae bacterium]|nr:hypothetical protein [Anaerolineae bacterium]
MQPSSIAGINRLPYNEKREIYNRSIPPELLDRFHLNPYLVDETGNDLLVINGPAGSNSVEMSLYHQIGFRDPILYGHFSDTLNGRIHILLYIMNDPEAIRFDVDRLEDGTATMFGTHKRNLEAEMGAMEAGLCPGQIRQGLHLASSARETFDEFIANLGHDRYFVEPLYYHNATIFERYGFAYQSGRKRMEKIHARFTDQGELLEKLDGSPFRSSAAANSIRLRSWAIHDGILGEAFTNVTMYKIIGKDAGINTAPGCKW